jgi:hypothetical protein
MKEKACRPTRAFVIFEDARSMELMTKQIKKIDLEETGWSVEVKKASNPDMIIWETISKRDENKCKENTGRLLSQILMVCVTIGAFYGYQFFQRHIFEMRYMADPPGIDCQNFYMNSE